MLIAFAGLISGYNGSFEFKEPGVSYEDYPYYGMRLVSITFFIDARLSEGPYMLNLNLYVCKQNSTHILYSVVSFFSFSKNLWLGISGWFCSLIVLLEVWNSQISCI